MNRDWKARLTRHNIDAHRIMPGLYQGSRPPTGLRLRAAGFAAVVLAAQEHQPKAELFPGIKVIHAPLDDDANGLTKVEWKITAHAVKETLSILRVRGRVLVTCWMGINRSGLISALSAAALTGMDGRSAVKLVQLHRPGALRNPAFVTAIRRVSGLPTGQRARRMAP